MPAPAKARLQGRQGPPTLGLIVLRFLPCRHLVSLWGLGLRKPVSAGGAGLFLKLPRAHCLPTSLSSDLLGRTAHRGCPGFADLQLYLVPRHQDCSPATGHPYGYHKGGQSGKHGTPEERIPDKLRGHRSERVTASGPLGFQGRLQVGSVPCVA